MKKIFLLISLLFLCSFAKAQNTIVNATVADSDTTTWANGSWSISFHPNPNFPNLSQYKLINGASLNPTVTQQSGTMNSSGVLAVTVYDSSLITPTGSGWSLTVCPKASASCGIYTFSTSGASMDISANLTTVIPPPRFNAIAGAFGYADIEAIVTIPTGATYFNVISQCQKLFANGIWNCPAAGGGGTISGQAVGVLPLPCGPTNICNQSQIDQNVTNTTTITSKLSFVAPTLGGFSYASQLQTPYGTGNNGIINCFLSKTFCLADPSYSNIETPYTFNGTLTQSPNASIFQDFRNGINANFYHNPGTTSFLSAYREPYQQIVVNDTTQNAPTGSGSITAPLKSIDQWIWYQAPGLNIGNPAIGGPSGWHIQAGHQMNIVANSPGITPGFSCLLTKSGVGDNFCIDSETTNYGGATAPSDEGNLLFRGIGGTSNTQYKGTIASGGTGVTSLTVNCTQDCANPGDNRFLINTQTNISTGNVTVSTLPSGNTPGNFTIDQTITPSTAWGTLNGNCVPAISAPVGVAGTSITCNVTMLSGTFSIGDQVCFSGNYFEQAILTGATPTSFTASLRHQHGTGTWIMANGPGCSFIDLAAYDVTIGATPLSFNFPIIGATGANTLQYAWFDRGGTINGIPNVGQFIISTFASTTLNNIGGIVTLTPTGRTLSSNPELYTNSTITITNSVDTAYNGQCTNTFLVPGTSNQLGCTQSSSNGHGTSATATISWGTTGFGNSAYKLNAGAEVLDVQTCTTSPCKISPGSVTTFTLGENNVTWNTLDSVIEPQHFNFIGKVATESYFINNPARNAPYARDLNLSGTGVCCSSPSSFSSFAYYKFLNSQANSTYLYHGGLVTPPGGLQFTGASGTGLFNYYLSAQFAPDPIGASSIWFGCPLSGCTDKNYFYNLLFASGNNGNATFIYRPAYNKITMGGGIINLNTALGAQIFNDNITFGTIATPGQPTLVAKTTGGTIPDATTRCYTTTVRNSVGETPQGTERCITTGSSGSNTNSIQVDWLQPVGATNYRICEGSTGAELLAFSTNQGPDSTTWIDTGVTSSGACSTTNTTLGGISGAFNVKLNSAGTANTANLTAAAGMGASATITFPSVSSTLAALASPAFTGTPAAPTPATGDNSTTLATTAYVKNNLPLSGTTASIGGGALVPGACVAGTVTITGATTSMVATASPSADPDSSLSTGIGIYAFVSSSNTVTVRICAIVAVTPTAVTYNVRVIQ